MTFHMTDAERHLARQFGLHPQEARALDALREAVGYCPDEVVVSGSVYRSYPDSKFCSMIISRLRKKLRGHGIKIVRVKSLVGNGYRLEAA